MSSQNGHTGVVKLLLENGARPDIRAADGSTALMPAAQNGHSEVVRLLCEWGSDMNMKTIINNTGYSALMLANKNKWKDTAGILESIGTEE